MQEQNQTLVPVEPMLTLDKLPDICLEQIFLHINDLESEIFIAQTCHRFQYIMKTRIWRFRYEYRTLCMEKWLDLVPTAKLEYFLRQIYFYIETLEIHEDCLSSVLKDLEEMKVTELPNVTTLQIESHYDCYPQDADILKLTQILPNLKIFQAEAPITGRYIEQFHNLEVLNLYINEDKDFEIKSKYFVDICKNLKNLRFLDVRNYEFSQLDITPLKYCMNLEVLKLNLSCAKTALDMILNLPKLKSLTILFDWLLDVSRVFNVDSVKMHETKEFYEILNTQCERITGIIVDGYFMPLELNWDKDLDIFKYNNLEMFAYCSYRLENCDLMLEKYYKMTKLKYLCLIDWPQLKDSVILEFIKSCTQLVHLDVSHCKNLTRNLPNKILSILKEQKRKKPLNIYFMSAGFEDEVDNNPEYWEEQKLLKFNRFRSSSFDKTLSYVDRGYQFLFLNKCSSGTNCMET